MTSNQFVNNNYQVTKIVGSGADAVAIVLKEREIDQELKKASKSDKYFIFKNCNIVEQLIDGEKLKTYIEQLSV